MNREAIMSALFALVSASPSLVTKSRRLRLWDQVSSGEKPALFMYERGDTYVRQGPNNALPPSVTMDVDLFIYIDAGKDQSIAPITVMNPIVDAIDLALRPGPASGGRQSLGGLVSHCWIEGKVMKEPGDLDGDGIALIPIKILATI